MEFRRVLFRSHRRCAGSDVSDEFISIASIRRPGKFNRRTLRITGQALNAQYLRALRNREHPGFGRSGQGSPNTLRAGHRKYPRTLKRCVERVTHGIQIREELRSEEHTSELQSLMRISYAVFCLKKKKTIQKKHKKRMT